MLNLGGRWGEDFRVLFTLAMVTLAVMPKNAGAGETLVTGPACAIDGDSLIIGGEMAQGRCRGGSVEIRLAGIDAPEWNQTCGAAGKEWPCGEAATAAVRAMIAGRDITCAATGRDRYRRTLAACEAGGTDIARRLVADGLALAYLKYSDIYVGEEAAARSAGRGMWAGPFMRPENFRKKNLDLLHQ